MAAPYVLYVGFFRRPSTGEIAPYCVTTAPGFDTKTGEVKIRIELDADKLNALFALTEISTFSGSIEAVTE